MPPPDRRSVPAWVLRGSVVAAAAAWVVSVGATMASDDDAVHVLGEAAWTVPFVVLLLPAWLRPGVLSAVIATGAVWVLAGTWVLPALALPTTLGAVAVFAVRHLRVMRTDRDLPDQRVGDATADPDALVDAYTTTILEIEWGGRRCSVVPLPEGRTEGQFPADASVVHVVTAHNPGSQRLPGPENDERDRQLEQQLRERRWRCHRAVGRSPDGSWSEDGFAIVDAPVDEVVALARAHGQNAIFEWTPVERAVVWCDDGRRDVHGWSVT